MYLDQGCHGDDPTTEPTDMITLEGSSTCVWQLKRVGLGPEPLREGQSYPDWVTAGCCYWEAEGGGKKGPGPTTSHDQKHQHPSSYIGMLQGAGVSGLGGDHPVLLQKGP